MFDLRPFVATRLISMLASAGFIALLSGCCCGPGIPGPFLTGKPTCERRHASSCCKENRVAAKKDGPIAAPHPRFHPVPTRPVFAPKLAQAPKFVLEKGYTDQLDAPPPLPEVIERPLEITPEDSNQAPTPDDLELSTNQWRSVFDDGPKKAWDPFDEPAGTVASKSTTSNGLRWRARTMRR